MIHLDTNFLIGVANRHLPVEQALVGWIRKGETFSVSSIAWAEFLNGPVKPIHVQQMAVLIQDRIIPFGRLDAEIASRLFNQTGRRRTTQPDCFIAATAIRSGVKLATQNQKHFLRFVPLGLTLA